MSYLLVALFCVRDPLRVTIVNTNTIVVAATAMVVGVAVNFTSAIASILVASPTFLCH